MQKLTRVSATETVSEEQAELAIKTGLSSRLYQGLIEDLRTLLHQALHVALLRAGQCPQALTGYSG